MWAASAATRWWTTRGARASRSARPSVGSSRTWPTTRRKPEVTGPQVWDDDHLIFVDIRSPGTVANLRQNPAIEVNVVDQLVRKGYRFKGTAEVLTAGPVFDQGLATRRARGAPNPMRAVVLMTVERALPITSPAYDVGVSEDDLREHYRHYWQELWSSGGQPERGSLVK